MLEPRSLSRIPEEYGGGTFYTRPIVEPVLSPSYQPVNEPIRMTAVSTKTTRKVRVTDDQGTPLPGAHVYFDQNNGTTANFNGEATVSSTDPSRKVYISYVGFEPKGFRLQDLPSSVRLSPGEMLNEVIVDAPAKAAKTDSQVPKYLFPAIGGIALLAILMSMGSPAAPKEVTL